MTYQKYQMRPLRVTPGTLASNLEIPSGGNHTVNRIALIVRIITPHHTG